MCESQIKIIVGLGNPGGQYEKTRHNVGFDVVDELAEKFFVNVTRKKFSSLIGETGYKDKKLILVKPQQYMNLSGQALATIKGFYKVDLKDIIVISDDMALEVGMIRIRAKGSAGGHNGLKDIIEKLSSNEFGRIRIGIGRSRSPQSIGHVLGRIPKDQADLICQAKQDACQAVFEWLDKDINSAMNRFNKKVSNGQAEEVEQ